MIKHNAVTHALVKSWWGVPAIIGGCLWAAKSIAILATGTQPDYLFELAPAALALASFGLALAMYRERTGSRLPVGLGVLALVASGAAGISYLIRGDDEGLFGPATLIAMLSIIVILFWVGRSMWRFRRIERWRAIPYLLAWSIVVALPVGALISAINERLLEIPLLAISAGWIWLGASSIASAFRVAQVD